MTREMLVTMIKNLDSEVWIANYNVYRNDSCGRACNGNFNLVTVITPGTAYRQPWDLTQQLKKNFP